MTAVSADRRPGMFRIRVPNKQACAYVPGKRNLLAELELSNARGSIIDGCRGGGCGICLVKVKEGDFRCDKMSKAQVTEQELEQGYALACKLYPQSDLVLDVVGKRFRSVAFEEDLSIAVAVPSPAPPNHN